MVREDVTRLGFSLCNLYSGEGIFASGRRPRYVPLTSRKPRPGRRVPKPSDLPQVLAEARGAGAATLWLQLGPWDDAVAADAESAGLAVVMDRCLKIEHARFHGGLHLAGFDTGVISSRRHSG